MLVPPGKGMQVSRILVVDDEPDVGEEAIESLRLAGLDGVLADSARAALQILAADEEIAAVVTDIRMPDSDGAGFVSMLVNRKPAVPVFVMTGHGDLEVKTAVLQAGAKRLFQKPCDLDELATALRALIESHACRP